MGHLRCEGLIVVVGPNSSGKTLLLRDILARLTGSTLPSVVASHIQVGKPSFAEFLSCLETEGHVKLVTNVDGTKQIRPRTLHWGPGQPINEIGLSQAEGFYRAYLDTPTERQPPTIAFLSHFGRLLVAALFLDRRLSTFNQVGLIDFVEQPPQQDLHEFYLHDAARAAILAETMRVFRKAVWPDHSRGNSLCLRVSDGAMPSAEERLSPSRMATFRTIESEGDGLKSYVATCMALLLARRPVCLIDEPEMCLHPPQALSLGRFIAEHAASHETVTFVTTHSSQVLRGLIQRTTDMQIVRLTRTNDAFRAHLLDPHTLAQATSKPAVKAEAILQGTFSSGVVVVEGDGDRLVYQAVWQALSQELDPDVSFVAVSGIGGIADACRLYRALRIPVAVVADLDLVSDFDKLHRVVSELADLETANTIVTRARAVVVAIRNLAPSIMAGEVVEVLRSILAMPMNWNTGDDARVVQALGSLRNRLERSRRLKEGIDALPVDLLQALGQLLNELSALGVFAVPVGELEHWLEGRVPPGGTANKWAWANTAAAQIESEVNREGDIWDFVRAIGRRIGSD